MALHALYAFQLHEEVTIQSDDTEVLIVCIGPIALFYGKLFIQRGGKANLRTISIELVVRWLPWSGICFAGFESIHRLQQRHLLERKWKSGSI